MKKPEYVKIQFSKTPQEFIYEYDLKEYVHNSWVYHEVLRGAYGLPQSGILAKKLLHKQLEDEGYYEAQTTPGIWRHNSRTVMFCLIVDNFGLEYVGKQHAKHLANVLKQQHTI